MGAASVMRRRRVQECRREDAVVREQCNARVSCCVDEVVVAGVYAWLPLERALSADFLSPPPALSSLNLDGAPLGVAARFGDARLC